MSKLISLHCANYIYLSMIDIINTCIMYRFYTYYKYIIIIVIFLFSFKLQKWFSQDQWQIFLQCAMINMNGRQNEYWTASPLRPKSGSNIAKLLLHAFFLSALYSLLKPKSLCLWGYLQRPSIFCWYSDAYKCVYVIVQSRQKGKRKSAVLSHRRDGACM